MSVRPAIMRRSVLLPLPDDPSSTNSSPSPTSRETLLTTGCPAYLLIRSSTTMDILRSDLLPGG
jgi:hypothetical protein